MSGCPVRILRDLFFSCSGTVRSQCAIVLVMHHDRHSYLCRVVKLRHPARRHVDASVTSVVNPYASAESASPVSIVEALTGPCDA